MKTVAPFSLVSFLSYFGGLIVFANKLIVQ